MGLRLRFRHGAGSRVARGEPFEVWRQRALGCGHGHHGDLVRALRDAAADC